jgi:hypothetical protein
MRSVGLLGLLVGIALVGCATKPANEIALLSGLPAAQGPSPTPTPAEQDITPTPENTSLAEKSIQYLCDHLADLEQMPRNHHDFSGDAVYDAFKRKGHEAMPCLVEKITDTQPAKNPTGAPFWAGLTYRVGDTAVLMLMDMNEMFWPRGMLARKYEDLFESEGMFSYYFYVQQVPGARKDIQRWWRKWLRSCTPKCEIVPSIER